MEGLGVFVAICIIFGLGFGTGSCAAEDIETHGCKVHYFEKECEKSCAPRKPLAVTRDAQPDKWECGCVDPLPAEKKGP